MSQYIYNLSDSQWKAINDAQEHLHAAKRIYEWLLKYNSSDILEDKQTLDILLQLERMGEIISHNSDIAHKAFDEDCVDIDPEDEWALVIDCKIAFTAADIEDCLEAMEEMVNYKLEQTTKYLSEDGREKMKKEANQSFEMIGAHHEAEFFGHHYQVRYIG